MKISDNELAIMLLNSDLGHSKQDINILTLSEWSLLFGKMLESDFEPDVIFKDNMTAAFSEMGYEEEFIHRVKCLADRAVEYSVELESLNNNGIYTTTIMDEGYPLLLRRKLGSRTPPVFFYAGDKSLSNTIGIGVVGSRNVSPAGNDFARELARQACAERLCIYSGGARGVDSISEISAMNAGGIAVEYVADSIFKKLKSRDVMRAVLDNRLLLMSDMNPRTGFIAWRAMNRNKYIYASSYATFVVESDYNKGGTWTGAKEAISKGYTKVFVRNAFELKGNQELIKLGGIPYDQVTAGMKELIMSDTTDAADDSVGEAFEQLSIFDFKDE